MSYWRDWSSDVCSSDLRAQMFLHCRTVARDEIVRPGAEQMLAILPRRADQRDAASERLEDADGRDPRQRRHIEASRHVHCCDMPRKNFGRPRIRQKAMIKRAGGADQVERRGGVAT